MEKQHKICMVVQDRKVKGGIAAVLNGYFGSELEKDFEIKYVESYKDGNKFSKLIKAIIGYIHFLKVLIIEKPELVHIHSSFGPSFYRKMPFILMASWAKKSIINHCHGADFETFYLKANDRKKKLIKKIYNKCSLFIALSDEWKKNLSLIVPLEKIQVVENYSLMNENAAMEKMNRKSNNQILFLGQICQRKGCFDIPTVVGKVVKIFPEVKFILAGSGEIKQLKKLLKEKGLEKNVIFPGWVRDEEKDKLLRESDVFFLPSYNEGMPMAILDAMGYGLPIVTTNVGGIPKLVVDGRNGYTCNPGDVNGFAEKLITLLKNEQHLKNLGTESFHFVKRQYSLETHIHKVKEIYNTQLQ